MTRQANERGDTLVEVLIAVAILSAAIVGGLTIMNYGYAIANNAVERTQVQATMNGQLAYIRYARDASIRSNKAGSDAGSQLWLALEPKIVSGTPSNNPICNGVAPQHNAVNSFYIQENLVAPTVSGFNGASATTFAQPGSGMWIEAYRSAGPANINYVDFYVKACWAPSGNSTNQEARTVMRLYVP